MVDVAGKSQAGGRLIRFRANNKLCLALISRVAPLLVHSQHSKPSLSSSSGRGFQYPGRCSLLACHATANDEVLPRPRACNVNLTQLDLGMGSAQVCICVGICICVCISLHS